MERNYILFDTPARDLLYPFTYTRPVAACRVGILTIQEKWELWLGTGVSHFTVSYLQEKFPLRLGAADTVHVLINGHVLPDQSLVDAIAALQPGQELYRENHLLAKAVPGNDLTLPAEDRKDYTGTVSSIELPWHLFSMNDKAIRDDFQRLTAGRTSAPVSSTNQVVGPEAIFIEPGAVIECSVLNAGTGPVYIGRNAQVMEGCLIRGPFALGEGAALKMGTKVYGATTLGPGCTGGGEIKNVIMFGYSNKGHDGYLGDAVIGEWCNLGANTTCSNLKNNAGTVKIWIEARGEAWPAGRKCGTLMGDHSRCGINTMLNTGTVIGVSCNIFGGDFPPKFVPSFSWGGRDPEERYRLQEALRDATAWMDFKGREMTDADRRLMAAVYELATKK
jgi:UDP-N-acetylglucosamine diphosphorylase/glucosamine-1-phosphate N-acetyltransferase